MFSSSVLFAVLGEAILFTHPGWISQILVQSLGSLALVGVATVSAWNSNQNRIDSRVTAVSSTASAVKKLPLQVAEEAVTNFNIARADQTLA